MLAGKTFNTEAQLSRDLMSRAVELVREQAGKFQWIATSQPFSEVPETNKSEAFGFLREYQEFDSHPRNLFIMTWSVHPAV